MREDRRFELASDYKPMGDQPQACLLYTSNQEGFTEELNRWLSADSINLFYFVFESYNQVSQLIGPAKMCIRDRL